MKRKTYGVVGLMDWTTQIKVGKGTVAVHFSGGALTAYGVTPAKYSTSNAFFQTVIENSEQYKSGRIQLLGEMEVESGESVERGEVRGKSGETAESAEKVQVADKSDAIEYLKEKYPEKGYTAVKLRTKAAFDAACSECGVEFEYTA